MFLVATVRRQLPLQWQQETVMPRNKSRTHEYVSVICGHLRSLYFMCVRQEAEPYKDVSDWEKCVWQRVIESERGWDAPLFFCVLGFCFVFFKHSLKDVHKQSPFPDRLKRELFLPQGLDYNKISMRIKVSGRLSSPHNHDTFRECILLKWGL